MDDEGTPFHAEGDATDRNNGGKTPSQQKRKRNAKKRRRTGESGGSGNTAIDLTNDAQGQVSSAKDEKSVVSAAAAATEEETTETTTASSEWGCPACTFLNGAMRLFCEMCGSGNPTQPTKKDVPVEWNCVACTMKNAPSLRSCGVCGTINPNPSHMLPSVLSIARRSLHGGLFLGGADEEGDEEEEDDEDDEDEDSDDAGGSSSSDESSEDEADRRPECPCLECGMTINVDQTNCSHCDALRPLPRRKLKRSDLSERLHKLSRKMAKHEKKNKKKSKSKEKDSKRSIPVKNAYGVSSEVLQKLMLEPKSTKLVDTLQTLTHTLAMMDASADSEWGDMHGGGGASAFFVHGFGGGGKTDKGKDTALLGVVSSIFQDEASLFTQEVRVFAVQSINYLLKMDRHLFKKEEALATVRIYLGALNKWCGARQEGTRATGKDEQMIIEECVNGLSGLCGTEGAMLRELTTPQNLDSYLDFLDHLAGDEANALHTSIVANALELFQKCCMVMKWDATQLEQARQVSMTKRIVHLLRSFLKHKQTALHVNASKCLLLLVHRVPREADKEKVPSIVSTLVTSDVVRELVDVLASKRVDEPEDARQAAATLLMHLLDSHSEMLALVIRDKIYVPLLGGVAELLLPSSGASKMLSSHSLKLVSLLIRRVCGRPRPTARPPTNASPAPHNRLRLDSLPDPDVLASLLVDFIRADSIPAVSAVLKDGADLNFSSLYDASGRELDKPLVVAAEVASLAMVRFLIKRGAAIHQSGPSGTALHVAAVAGRCDVVSFLLECGASPTDVDREGRTVVKFMEEMNASSDAGACQASPAKKLLDLHQRVHGLGEGSDLSDDEGEGGTRRWVVSGEHHSMIGDDDDEFSEEDDEDDPYYMDYDHDEDDEDMDSELDDDMSTDDDEARESKVARPVKPKPLTPSPADNKKKKRRRDSVASESSDHKETKKNRRGANHTSPAKSEKEAKKNDNSDTIQPTPDQVSAVSETIMNCLINALRAVDHSNVNRSVLSTLACALEMAPSSLARSISDGDVSLILETVNHLLQDPALYTLTSTVGAAPPSPRQSDATDGRTSSMATKTSGTAAVQTLQKSILSSYILAIRLLQAIVRKSPRDSSVFYEVERRGICEQIERLHSQSSRVFESPSVGTSRHLNDHCGGIFGRGLQLLAFLRANMVESGMLHLHRLKNMANRLKEVIETTPTSERDMILVDLVELFEDRNSITSHEFKQSNLLEAVLAFLVPSGQVDPVDRRVALLLKHFSRSPAAFTSFVSRLQAVVNQEENLPLLSFFTGKGRELYPLTKQLKIVCSRAQKDPSKKGEPAPGQKMLQLSSLTHFQSFEKTIFRCMPAKDPKLSSFYMSLVGHAIHRAVDSKWKKFWVCGFDQQRCMHLLKPVEDANADAVEVVLHDSQYKLTAAVDVRDEILSFDFDLFGVQLVPNAPAASGSDDKKQKRQSKKRRRSSASNNAPADPSVEVLNAPGVNAGKLKGAWYAGEIVVEKNDGEDGSGGAGVTTIEPEQKYTVRVLGSGSILKNVGGKMIRTRTARPQVGSVVEVDGLLGEVTREQATASSSDESGAEQLYDVKVSRDRERKGIKLQRIRYPPTGSSIPASSSGIIEAMSLSRLFPPRESSLIAGSVGDRVWIAPPVGSTSLSDLYLSGSIHSFPAGVDAIGESAAVFVDVSFGQCSSVIKVLQSRVINLANGRSRTGSSRLLSALQQASERSGSSSGASMHRLLQSGNRELFGNRPLTGPGSSSSLEQLRQLLSQSSSSSREAAWATFASAASASTDSLPGGASFSTSTDAESDGKSSSSAAVAPKSEDAATRLNRVWKHAKFGDKKTNQWKCTRPPKVSVLIGYVKCENVDSMPFEEEFGAARMLFPSKMTRPGSTSTQNEMSLTTMDVATKKAKLKPQVAAAMTKVFTTFQPTDAGVETKTAKKKSKKNKKRKLNLSPETTESIADSATSLPWDIEKFTAFTSAAFGVSAFDDPEGTLVDNCIQFSLFASPSTRRRLLDLDGFLASVADTCKSAKSARHLLAFLVARGHNSASLASSSSKEDTEHETTKTASADGKAEAVSCVATATTMRSFASDQNMLKCLSELQQVDASQDMASNSSPPWKFKYFVQCDLSVDWTDAAAAAATKLEENAVVATPPVHGNQLATSLASNHVTAIDGVASDSPMMKSVQLLRFLYEAQRSKSESLSVPDDVWRNARLTNKLQTQMEDVLSICSGIYPAWCDAVISECKFFFPLELREKLFRATAFGCTRSLHWFRNQLNMEDSSASSGNNNNNDSLANGGGIAGDGIYNHEISISPIPKERVKVNRDTILNSAEAVMKLHGKRKAILDIVFVGEKGYGSGVTAAFYSATAQALQSVEENRKQQTRCWVAGIESEREDDTIRHPNGLFPFPHMDAAANAKLLQRFRMMGRLAGKALMDDRLFPLPLSTQFMKLVLGQRVSVEDLENVFLSHGKVLKCMKLVVEEIDAGNDVAMVMVDGMPVAEWVDAVSFTFIDPLSQKPLEPKGDDKPVTVANMKAYVDKVLALWLHDGIHAQVEAFRDGISDVLPLAKLNLLFVHELLTMLCGDADVVWDAESLLTTMKLAHGYTKDSTPVRFFVDALAEMTVPERRQFLLYATGCPNLPAGGFAALRPPFEVVRRVVDTDNVDQALPFARTCTNTLHLPAYSSKEVLDERVRFAIANSAGVIDRD